MVRKESARDITDERGNLSASTKDIRQDQLGALCQGDDTLAAFLNVNTAA